MAFQMKTTKLLNPQSHLFSSKLSIISATPPKEILRAVITTIPKPGKPVDDVMNYRTISLLNCNIKIFSKLIADRVNMILLSRFTLTKLALSLNDKQEMVLKEF